MYPKFFIPLLWCAAWCSAAAYGQTQNSAFEQVFQTKLATLRGGENIAIPAGNFDCSKGVWIDGVSELKITGAGMAVSVLDFAQLGSGSEAWNIGSCRKIVLEGFTIRNAPADGLRLQNCENIVLRNVAVEWTDKSRIGSYGIFAINSKNVVMDNCTVSGAAHGGLVAVCCSLVEIVRCSAKHNVVGIASENSQQVEIHACTAENNSIGIAAIQLPMIAVSKNVYIYDNIINKNTHQNFAPDGDFIACIGSGIGVFALSTQQLHIAQNTIEANPTAGLLLMSQSSLLKMGIAIAEKSVANELLVHDNTWIKNGKNPESSSKLGAYLTPYNGNGDILYDGTAAAACIREEAATVFSVLPLQNLLPLVSHDVAPFQCNPAAFFSGNKP